jgi:hypothetical protein
MSKESPPPVSDESYQQVLNQSESYEQAAITAYTAGFFDGEGAIVGGAKSKNGSAIGYTVQPRVTVQLVKHQMSGLFDAEGCIELAVQQSNPYQLGFRIRPATHLQQTSDKSILESIFDRYSSVAGFDYSIIDISNPSPNEQDSERATIHSADDIEAFLRPLIPLLGEKRRQAKIMVNEFLPAYRRGKHGTKEGFIEMMKIKERMDEQKPMDKADRKYTVEFFEDLWADDIEAQTKIFEHAGGGR